MKRNLFKWKRMRFIVYQLLLISTCAIAAQAQNRQVSGKIWRFWLKILFKYPVWADHSVTKIEMNKVPNNKYSNDELRRLFHQRQGRILSHPASAN